VYECVLDEDLMVIDLFINNTVVHIDFGRSQYN
jgi:hypothetical protein